MCVFFACLCCCFGKGVRGTFGFELAVFGDVALVFCACACGACLDEAVCQAAVFLFCAFQVLFNCCREAVCGNDAVAEFFRFLAVRVAFLLELVSEFFAELGVALDGVTEFCVAGDDVVEDFFGVLKRCWGFDFGRQALVVKVCDKVVCELEEVAGG